MWNARMDVSQAGIKIAGRNINNLRYTTLMVESEELKSLLMKVKEDSEKIDLKLSIQKTKITASGPIISWQIMGKQWKQWQALFYGTPKSLQMVTAAMKSKDVCSLEEKLWQTYTAYKKSRHYSANKSLSTQSSGFSSSHVWLWVLDYRVNWTLKNDGMVVFICGVGEDPW